MNHLSDIILNLNKEEARSYKLFASRVRFENSDGKITRLFDFIRDGKYQEDEFQMVKALFGTENYNAYYRLKNRLLEDVQRSLLMHHYHMDSKVAVMNLIKLARIFFYKSRYAEAYNYLQKAERKANEGKYFELLNIIYDEMLVLGRHFLSFNPELIIEKQAANSQKLVRLQENNALLATLNYQLRQTNFSGKENALLKTIEQTRKKLNLASDVDDSSDLRFKIHECIKNALLFRKDFLNLEIYLEKSYTEFEKARLFNRDNYDSKIILLVWLLNTCYKNRHIKQMGKYLQHQKNALFAFNKLHYEKYLWAYTQSLMLYHVAINKLDNAIALLEEYKQIGKSNDVINFDINVYLNLATFYYFKKDFKNANVHLKHLLSYSIYNQLSSNWRFTVDVVDLLVQIDNQDLQYAEHKLSQIKRIYTKELKTPAYEKEMMFLKILGYYVKESNKLKSRESTQLESFLKKYKKVEPGSNEALHYTMWLKARVQKQGYYDLLLAELGGFS